jgi:hypothetical protein
MNLIAAIVVFSGPGFCLGYAIYRDRRIARLEAWARELQQRSVSSEVPQAFQDAFEEVLEP